MTITILQEKTKKFIYKKKRKKHPQTNPHCHFFWQARNKLQTSNALLLYPPITTQHPLSDLLLLICRIIQLHRFITRAHARPSGLSETGYNPILSRAHRPTHTSTHYSEHWPVRSCLSRWWSTHQSHAWISRSEEPSRAGAEYGADLSLFVVCHSVSDTGKIYLLSTCHGFQTEGLYSVSVNNVSNMSEWVYVVFVTHYTKSMFPVSRDNISAHSYCLLINQFK